MARRDDQAIRRRLLSDEPNRAIERLHQEQARFRLSQALSGEMPAHLAGPYGRGTSDLYLGFQIPLLTSSSIESEDDIRTRSQSRVTEEHPPVPHFSQSFRPLSLSSRKDLESSIRSVRSELVREVRQELSRGRRRRNMFRLRFSSVRIRRSSYRVTSPIETDNS